MKMLNKIKKDAFAAYVKADKMLARLLGSVLAVFGSTIVAHAESAGSSGGGAWDSIVAWINNNTSGLKAVAFALIGLSLIASIICLVIGANQGMSKVKNWLIGLCVAVVILTFGEGFLYSLAG